MTDEETGKNEEAKSPEQKEVDVSADQAESELAHEPEASTDEQDQDIQGLLEDARAKADQHFDQLVRLQAEMENLRKRTKRDLEAAHKFALEKICQEMLPVRDSMEMGLVAAEMENADLDTMRQGVDLTLKMFVSLMEKFSIKEVSSVKGDKLNPEFHQAMSVQEDADAAPNTILTVVQKGYTLNGRLMRPAMVIIAKAVTVAVEEGEEPKLGSEIDTKA